MSDFFRIFLVFIAVLLFFSCGNSPPEINQIYNQINFRLNPDTDRVYSGLVVLVNADDDDGEDNIEFVHIVNEKEQLYWVTDRAAMTERDSRGMKWMGFQNITMPEGESFPPGEYGVIVTDKAGDKDEDSIFIPLNRETPGQELFPKVRITDNPLEMEVVSPERRNLISFYNSAGDSLGAFAVTPGILDLSRLTDGQNIIDNWYSMQISVYSNSIGAGLVYGPVYR